MIALVHAFDIDGTLRCSCTETCRDINEDVLEEARLQRKKKNVTVIAWSGGGKQYAQSFIDSDDRLRGIFGTRCYGKLEYIQKYGKPDLATDDQQDFSMAHVNMIVREK